MQKEPTHLIVHHLSLPPSGTPIRADEDILGPEHNHRENGDQSEIADLPRFIQADVMLEHHPGPEAGSEKKQDATANI